MKRAIFLLVGMLLATPLSAADTTRFYAQAFENTGVIDDVQEKKDDLAIVVDDAWYRLAPDVRVHGSPDGGLQKRMKIGFTAQNARTSSAIITEIWVLPQNWVLPNK